MFIVTLSSREGVSVSKQSMSMSNDANNSQISLSNPRRNIIADTASLAKRPSSPNGQLLMKRNLISRTVSEFLQKPTHLPLHCIPYLGTFMSSLASHLTCCFSANFGWMSWALRRV